MTSQIFDNSRTCRSGLWMQATYRFYNDNKKVQHFYPVRTTFGFKFTMHHTNKAEGVIIRETIRSFVILVSFSHSIFFLKFWPKIKGIVGLGVGVGGEACCNSPFQSTPHITHLQQPNCSSESKKQTIKKKIKLGNQVHIGFFYKHYGNPHVRSTLEGKQCCTIKIKCVNLTYCLKAI